MKNPLSLNDVDGFFQSVTLYRNLIVLASPILVFKQAREIFIKLYYEQRGSIRLDGRHTKHNKNW